MAIRINMHHLSLLLAIAAGALLLSAVGAEMLGTRNLATALVVIAATTAALAGMIAAIDAARSHRR